MDEKTKPHSLFDLRTPAVRHLAWLCQAPQLLRSPMTLEPSRYLPDGYQDQLRHWDQHPDTLPPLLRETPPKRLGFYFERLYRVLLEELLGWEILIQNRQIQANGRTLGELDFIVHNRNEGRLEHHEIAIKYYLGVPETNGPTRWYGPNAKDRLDLKTSRMINTQSQRTRLPEAQALLAEAGISGPITPRLFMPGYLFYPSRSDYAIPDYVPADHLAGRWRYVSELAASSTRHWVVLNKPDWIGPWQQAHAPAAEESAHALAAIEREHVPLLFAALAQNEPDGPWREVDRIFVVPENWP